MAGRFYDILEAPFGSVSVLVDDQGRVHQLWTSDTGERFANHATRDLAKTARVREELLSYFNGELKEFAVPVVMNGSDFQKDVWKLLMEIPYGQTRTYGDLARKLGQPNASRAVGRANATNQISIIIPCHRVIGSTGALTGYAGGLDVKRSLLELEAAKLGNLFS